MITKKGFLKLIAPVIFLITVFQLLGCSSPQQTNSENLMLVNNLTNVASENPTPANKPISIGEENFVKEQRNRFETVAADLERNRHLWRENEIVNYDFVCSQGAGGNKAWSPALIKVREGKATLIEPASKSNIAYIDGYEKIDTVDKLFDYIRRELENGRKIEAKYNKKYGYLERVTIEYSYAIDAWDSIIITKFEIVK
jgi:hypothetical protein